MQALKYDLYQQGIQQLDTDTASTNLRAQHFYIKNQSIELEKTYITPFLEQGNILVMLYFLLDYCRSFDIYIC